jgi:hypothetical protein
MRGDLFVEQQRVVDEHRANDEDDHRQIKPAHPTADSPAQVTVVAGHGNVLVYLPAHEHGVRPRMTLAAGGDQIVRVDGGLRVGGRQDFVIAVTTGAMSNRNQAILRRQAVIAFHVGFHAVGRKVVFAVEIDRGVAAAANLGNDQRRVILQRRDFMFGMAVGAGGGIAFAGRHGLAVDTGRHIARFLGMALAAGLGLPHKMER